MSGCMNADNVSCSGNGQCVNDACVCLTKYTGALCNECIDVNADYANKCACKTDFVAINGECVANACLDASKVICSGQGHCIDGKCECNPAASGILCTSCSDVAVDTPQGCLLKCAGKCLQHGYECTSGIAENQAVCTCAQENFDPKDGCKHCLGGFDMINGECVPMNCIVNGVVCSNHGDCISSKCECYQEYTGDQCESCKPDAIKRNDYCLAPCVEGKCKNQVAKCVKDACECAELNADPDRKCIGCMEGYTQTLSGCQPHNCVTNHNICNDHGICENSACKCQPEFSGSFCEICADNKVLTAQGKCISQSCLDRISQEECAGNGTCTSSVGHDACTCKEGYEGSLCTRCNDNFISYQGKCLKKSCFADELMIPCSGNGRCEEDGKCFCNLKSNGIFCQHCNRGQVQLPDKSCVPISCFTNGAECSNQGKCIQILNDYKCKCKEGYSQEENCSTCKFDWEFVGGECISKKCIGRTSPLACSGNGSCQKIDAINNIIGCFCKEGYEGKFCDQCNFDKGFSHAVGGKCINKVCLGRNGYECGGNGTCFNPSEGLWECRCGGGATGHLCIDCNEGFKKLESGHCVFETCVEDGLECNGKGLCRQMGPSHRCICKDGFDGQTNCTKCMEGFSYNKSYGICTQGGNKLSAGAIAGIVIGVILFLVAICLVVFFVLKKKGGVKATKSKNTVPRDMQSGQKFSI